MKKEQKNVLSTFSPVFLKKVPKYLDDKNKTSTFAALKGKNIRPMYSINLNNWWWQFSESKLCE